MLPLRQKFDQNYLFLVAKHNDHDFLLKIKSLNFLADGELICRHWDNCLFILQTPLKHVGSVHNTFTLNSFDP